MARNTAKTNISYSLRQNVWRTIRLYWDIDKRSLISYLLLIGIQVSSGILSLYLASRIIGQLTLVAQGQDVSTRHIYPLVAGSTVAILLERLSWRMLSLIDKKSWIKWYVRISVDFNKATSSLDLEQHHDHAFEKKLQKVQQEYQYTPQNYANNILQCLHSVVRLASTFIVVLSFAPWLVIVMALALVPGFMTEKKYSNLKWNLWGEKGDKPMLAWRISHFLQDKNKLQETKIFGTRDHLIDQLSGLHTDFYERQMKHLKSLRVQIFASISTEVAVAGGITLWLIRQVLNGSLSLANYSFYSGVVFQFGSSLNLIVNSLNFIYDSNEYMKDLYRLFDLRPSLPRSKEPIKIGMSINPTITFSDVSFKYPNTRKWALRNATFTIRPGEKVAFVGENGAGKTTIVKLLLRFYDVTSGKILINDTDIRELDLPSYYDHIGVLFQNFNDYPFSVRDNIALGRVENFSDDAAVHVSAQIANADKFIKNYPHDYDQVLDVSFKDGIEPSGGQWQRIALARAIFRDANILVLDEPTAAVDAKSEYEIFKTLETHSANKTNIIISHRFSTVRRATTIYVINEGTIIERGSHKELVKIKNGLYREMFNKQAEGYR